MHINIYYKFEFCISNFNLGVLSYYKPVKLLTRVSLNPTIAELHRKDGVRDFLE